MQYAALKDFKDEFGFFTEDSRPTFSAERMEYILQRCRSVRTLAACI